MHNPLAASLRLLAFLLATLTLIPIYALMLGLGLKGMCRTMASVYWRAVILAVGLRVEVKGTPSAVRPTLFVANHISYFDIVVLGSLLSAYFVAKKEVSQWPGFGLMAKLGRTVFVDRRPRKSLGQRDEMAARLGRMGESLVLFPEGTSSDGLRVLPFKSALLSVAESGDLPVQPISLSYSRLDGMPMGRGLRPFFAWYGGMELVPHLWMALGLGRATIEVHFHPPVRLADFGSRKALAEYCHDVIDAGVVAANNGRSPGALGMEPA
ncbi:MAG TPA: 1-acyl-sn-glycerol-3-phosphate acyltransferase [Rhodospirillaceae bacterium]|nr:1-acyl-sn-glycerol-3-phosphate acyltransferase [Rhodospirillaceae bacterium]